MSVESTRAIGPAFFLHQDRLRGGPDPALCAPGYTARINTNPAMPLEGHQQFAAAFYGAFPDLHHTIEDTVADDEKVTVRFTLHGTHTGDFMGIPATGKSIDVPAIAIFQVADGRVASVDGVFDQGTMLRQLGVLPS